MRIEPYALTLWNPRTGDRFGVEFSGSPVPVGSKFDDDLFVERVDLFPEQARLNAFARGVEAIDFGLGPVPLEEMVCQR